MEENDLLKRFKYFRAPKDTGLPHWILAVASPGFPLPTLLIQIKITYPNPPLWTSFFVFASVSVLFNTWKALSSFNLSDTKVPVVKLIGTPPKKSTYPTGSFIWTSDETASFECAIDVVETGQDCGSGKTANWMTPELSEGEHTFYLFATDSNGNVGEPIKYTWKIGKYYRYRIILRDK